MLSDLVVLELASVLAGPSVGQFLAELGARVIKIENPRTGGDVTRSWRLSTEPDTGSSAYFASCNFGKESVALDLTTTGGRDALHRLARRSDVVIASYAPGQAERLGVDPTTLRAQNPRLIHASITGYGESESRTGYDAILQAETGFMHMNGSPGGPPVKMPVALVDVLTAHQVKQAILLALLERDRSGSGSEVSISLYDAAISSLVNQATNWLTAGHDPQRMGSDHPNIVPYGRPLRTADGHAVVLAVGTDRQFRALCGVLDDPETARDSRFRTNRDRVANRDLVYARLQERIRLRTRDSVISELHAARVPCGCVHRVSEVFDGAGAGLVLGELKGARGVRQAAFRHDGPEPRRPPHLGEHTRDVLVSVAGLSHAEIDSLLEDGHSMADRTDPVQ